MTVMGQGKLKWGDTELFICVMDSSWKIFFDTVKLMISDWVSVDCGLWILCVGLIRKVSVLNLHVMTAI